MIYINRFLESQEVEIENNKFYNTYTQEEMTPFVTTANNIISNRDKVFCKEINGDIYVETLCNDNESILEQIKEFLLSNKIEYDEDKALYRAILSTAIKEIENDYDIAETLEHKNHGFSFDTMENGFLLEGKNYNLFFEKTKDKENNDMTRVVIENENETIWEKTFYPETTIAELIGEIKNEI